MRMETLLLNRLERGQRSCDDFQSSEGLVHEGLVSRNSCTEGRGLEGAYGEVLIRLYLRRVSARRLDMIIFCAQHGRLAQAYQWPF